MINTRYQHKVMLPFTGSRVNCQTAAVYWSAISETYRWMVSVK